MRQGQEGPIEGQSMPDPSPVLIPVPLDDLQTLTSCSICAQLFNGSNEVDRPAYSFRCGHTFCRQCIQQLASIQQQPFCPTCRSRSQQTPVRNYALMDVVDMARRVEEAHTARMQLCDFCDRTVQERGSCLDCKDMPSICRECAHADGHKEHIVVFPIVQAIRDGLRAESAEQRARFPARHCETCDKFAAGYVVSISFHHDEWTKHKMGAKWRIEWEIPNQEVSDVMKRLCGQWDRSWPRRCPYASSNGPCPFYVHIAHSYSKKSTTRALQQRTLEWRDTHRPLLLTRTRYSTDDFTNDPPAKQPFAEHRRRGQDVISQGKNREKNIFARSRSCRTTASVGCVGWGAASSIDGNEGLLRRLADFDEFGLNDEVQGEEKKERRKDDVKTSVNGRIVERGEAATGDNGDKQGVHAEEGGLSVGDGIINGDGISSSREKKGARKQQRKSEVEIHTDSTLRGNAHRVENRARKRAADAEEIEERIRFRELDNDVITLD